MHAVMGKILWVDLTTGQMHDEAIPPEVYEKYLSGIGLAAWLLYQRIPPGADPLGPENVLGFVSGLLTATGSMMTGRWMVAGKSPLTGTWGDANCGGTLAPAIKQCGYDGIFFSGISPKPVYLYLGHAKAELKDAADLWGKDTRETETVLKERHSGRFPSVACIGPAGEKLSLIAGISNDNGRMAARSGLGAVMGSKMLKALVLQGSYRIPVADEAAVKRLSVKFSKVVAFKPPFLNGGGARLLGTVMRWLPLQMRQDGILYKIFLQKYGTTGLNQFSIETGDSPIRNWGGTNNTLPPSHSKSVNPDRIREREFVKYHCYSCPVGCGGMTHFNNNQSESHKPEYETVLALGGLLLNDDLETIFVANEMLNRAGMDTISAGGTMAFAIECYENGLITREDTGGLELKWGDTQAILQLLGMIIRREGIGDLLADGTRRAAERIGHGADKFAVQAGGQELAMHDPRNDPGFALHSVVEPTPGRHTLGAYLYYETFQLWKRVKKAPKVRPLFYPKGNKYRSDQEKAAWGAMCSQFTAVLNGAGACLFGSMCGVQRFPIFEWLNAATGWDKTPDEYMQIGWNIQTLRQAFNVRQRASLGHAINARPLGSPPLSDGANKNRRVPIDELKRLYWQEMGWDPATGAPSPAAVSKLLLINAD
ncbi:MAG TPA: aldehyde ferredoxin oxidoreductase family protein [Anaerolineaceae bacterium]|nr:aldehyde ferredoxin oxidoreductase family protein [Anaerolineaceae bacterium]